MDWKSIVKTVAPALGAALAGPMGGIATKFIADKFLGNPNATPDEIANAIQFAAPADLIKLKELDKNFELEMANLGVDIYRIDAADRERASKRQVDMKDWTPNIIAFLYLIGFFAVIYYFGRDGLLEQENVLITRLQDILIMIMSFFFGSSAGSRIKDYFIGKKQSNAG
jgi:hypothetical protein